MPAKYVVFEGCDSCGKGTQIELLKEELSDYKVEFVNEPWEGTPTGKAIREALKGYKLGGEAEAFRDMYMFFANRIELTGMKIAPLLKEGRSVFSDRNYCSTVAYEGCDELTVDYILNIVRLLDHKGLIRRPDLTLIFNISEEEFTRRCGAKVTEKYETKEFQKKVMKRYLSMPKLLSQENIKIINAEGSESEVHGRVLEALKPILKEME
jgi:dTMP kinase